MLSNNTLASALHKLYKSRDINWGNRYEMLMIISTWQNYMTIIYSFNLFVF